MILLLVLPVMMTWQGRKSCTLPESHNRLVPGGNFVLGIMGIIAISLLFLAVMY